MNKYILLLLSGLMFLFGGLQFNDPDPILWIAIYWVVALFGILLLFDKLPRVLIKALLIVLIIYSITFIPDFYQWMGDGFPKITGKMSKARPYTELMREFFGLVISVAVTIFMLKYNKSSTNK